MPAGNYNNAVLIGNWSEERLQNEYDFKTFLRIRDRKELLVQRARNLFKNLLMERPLEISGMYLLYGFNVQVVASDMPAKGKFINGQPQYGLALSVLVTVQQVDTVQNMKNGCLLTLSPITTPCSRNTFFIVSVKDENARGNKVMFGEEFYLKSVNYAEPEAPPLYVRYVMESVPSPADRMPLVMSSNKDTNCRFVAEPMSPSERMEGIGRPVLSGKRIVIKNCLAAQNLCVMNQNWFQTFFGLECGVKCQNVMDSHKRYTAENMFTFVSDIKEKSKD